VIDYRGDCVDADVGIKALPRELEHGVGYEVLGAQPLLDMRQVLIGRLDQVGRFAANPGRLRQAMLLKRTGGGSGRLLAGPLKGIEGIVINAALLVGKRAHIAGVLVAWSQRASTVQTVAP